jgi:hypothetical protein
LKRNISKFLKDKIQKHKDIRTDGVYIRLYVNNIGSVGATRYVAFSDTYLQPSTTDSFSDWMVNLLQIEESAYDQYFISDLGIICQSERQIDEVDSLHVGFFKYTVELWQFLQSHKEKYRRNICELIYGRELDDIEFINLYNAWISSINDLDRVIALKSGMVNHHNENRQSLIDDISITKCKRKLRL